MIASYRTADHCHTGPRNGSGRAIFGAGKTASGASLAHTGAFLSPGVKTGRAYCHIQLTVHSDQLLKGKGTISPAGIGKDPDRGIAECLWLWSPGDVALIGQGAVRRLTEKCHETWRKNGDLLFESRRGCDKLMDRQLVRPRRRPLDHGRQTTAMAQNVLVLLWLQLL